MDQTVTAIVAVASAIGSVVAAFAAWRAASIAKNATAHAEKVERGRLEREVALICNKVVAASMRVDGLSNDLKLGYQSLFTFAGQTGGSRQQMYTKEIEKTQGGVGHMQGEARAILEDRATLKAKTDDALAQDVIKIEGYLVQLERVKEKFTRELDSVAADNRIYRERALRGPKEGSPAPSE